MRPHRVVKVKLVKSTYMKNIEGTLKLHVLPFTLVLTPFLLLSSTSYDDMLKGICSQNMLGDHSPDALGTVTSLFSKSAPSLTPASCICAFAPVLTPMKGPQCGNTGTHSRASSSIQQLCPWPQPLILPLPNPYCTDSLLSQSAVTQPF